MKILRSLPKGDNLQHDAQLLNIIKVAKPGFILISSITVFLGVYSHLSGFLQGVPIWLAVIVYVVAYLLISLFPDVLNSVAAGYVFRSFIKKLHTDRHTQILIFFCLVLSVPLTRYSFRMSTTTTGAAIEAGAEERQPDANTGKIDSTYQKEIARINGDYKEEKASIESQYSEEMNVATVGVIAQIKALQDKINALEGGRREDNTQWVDKHQSDARDQIAALNVEKSEIELRVIGERKKALEVLKAQKDAKELKAEELRTGDRGRIITEATTKGEAIRSLTGVLKKQVSGLAGYAVFIVLMLTGVEQVLNHRNGIEFEFEFTVWDISNPVAEVLALPFTVAGRKIINSVRNAYNKLDPLADPVTTGIKN